MKKKSFPFIIISLFIIILLGSLFVFSKVDVKTEISEVLEQEKDYKVKESKDFIAVSHFKDYRDSITNENYNSLSKFSIESNKAFLENIEGIVFLSDKDELYSKLQSCESDCIGLLSVEDLEIRFKNIFIDKFNYFDKESVKSENPLRFSKEYIVKESELDGLNDYTIQEDTVEIEPSSTNELNRMFVSGEIITARGVDIKWLNLSNNNLEFLLDRVRPDIEQADLAVSMLEHSFSGNPIPCPTCTSFVGDDAVVDDLANVGFDIFSLGGNHIGDGGLAPQIRTEELLDENGIKYFGAGENTVVASAPEIIEFAGEKYAFLGAEDIASFYWAGEANRGSNRYSTSVNYGDGVIDVEKVKKDIAEAKKLADKVVIYMSWGTEYTNKATTHQEELGRLFIDNGADLVLSSHAHWVQNIEIYKGKLIFYGFGNFIFDQTHSKETSESIYVNLNFLGTELVNVEIVPILNCGYHFGASNLANQVISGAINYEEVDLRDPARECVWLQPKEIDSSHPNYNAILDRLFEFTKI